MDLRNIFLRHVAQTSPAPLLTQIVKARGMYLHTADGQQILDLISGIGVSALGHCHPAIVHAVQSQAEKYLHTMVYGEFVLSPQVQLAKKLVDLLPSSLDSVYFVNSGAEAVEGALKLAKKITGRYEIVACRNAYHGSTHGAMSLMSSEIYTGPFRPLLPMVRFIDYNEPVQLDTITDQTAAVIMETVQAESGIHPPENNYLVKVQNRCKETGSLFILDEIQCAYGRTGHFFAFEKYDVVPDILLLAKGMGGGMPIGAFVSSQENMSKLANSPALGHITTFGGHPVNCAAALATLEVIDSEKLIKGLPTKIDLFRQHLPHPYIQEIREGGLWFALDLGDAQLLQRVVREAADEGLLIDWFLFNDHSLRVAPPLIISPDEIIKACKILHHILDRC
ncbi:MAG: aspartate aminotransferase family protein [Saprospiraceae bacterium]|nr:aspartate aminotransferase family protein [Saprospiraceae bacterium]